MEASLGGLRILDPHGGSRENPEAKLWRNVGVRAYLDLWVTSPQCCIKAETIREEAIEFFESEELEVGTFKWICVEALELNYDKIKPKLESLVKEAKEWHQARLRKAPLEAPPDGRPKTYHIGTSTRSRQVRRT